ncbi:hypothetical protein MMOR_01780 [Mycolicibacterium moriokaense]|uniref:Uncharacterized protein n=1 Tax=Mycolicibacterium moriokaense TaxID=39691 RepID=A0AAD1H5D7_9MYCO|nr:hypothetical protein MMOR_01780 [Mycolicibacterium moriokaense]
MATIPVPITDANQFGPKCCSRASSVVIRAVSVATASLQGQARRAGRYLNNGGMAISLSIVGLSLDQGISANQAVLMDENFPWCDSSHKRTINATTGSGVTIPKSRHKG